MASQEAKGALEPFQRVWFRWDIHTVPFMFVQPPKIEPPNQEDIDQRAARIRNWVTGFLVLEFCKPDSPAHYQRGDVVWLPGVNVDFSGQRGFDYPTI